MKLTSMKRTKKNKTENEMAEPVAYDGDDYPYGLELRLEKTEIGKLGLDINDFSIGGTIDIVAKAEITHLSEPLNKDNAHSSASFQITDLAVKTLPNQKPNKLRDILDLVSAKLDIQDKTI